MRGASSTQTPWRGWTAPLWPSLAALCCPTTSWRRPRPPAFSARKTSWDNTTSTWTRMTTSSRSAATHPTRSRRESIGPFNNVIFIISGESFQSINPLQCLARVRRPWFVRLTIVCITIWMCNNIKSVFSRTLLDERDSIVEANNSLYYDMQYQFVARLKECRVFVWRAWFVCTLRRLFIFRHAALDVISLLQNCKKDCTCSTSMICLNSMTIVYFTAFNNRYNQFIVRMPCVCLTSVIRS